MGLGSSRRRAFRKQRDSEGLPEQQDLKSNDAQRSSECTSSRRRSNEQASTSAAPLDASAVCTGDSGSLRSAALSTAAHAINTLLSHPIDAPAPTTISSLLTGHTKDAQRLFHLYDADRDGRLSPAEVRAGLETWRLGLNADMFGQFLNCNFLYADRDLDGYLSLAEWTQLFKLMSEVSRKFARCDEDGDGMIDRAQFGRIIAGLDLALTPLMQRQYVDVNFRFVDRALRGKITFGQFLACYANFLYSYEISQIGETRGGNNVMQGMRRRRQVQPDAVGTLSSASKRGADLAEGPSLQQQGSGRFGGSPIRSVTSGVLRMDGAAHADVLADVA